MMSIRQFQDNQPWESGSGEENPYSDVFMADARRHRDFEHALIHVTKSMGRLATLVEHEDHERRFHMTGAPDEVAVSAFDEKREDAAGWLADLVICAMRMASVYPRARIDLESAVILRMAEKNPTWADEHKTDVSYAKTRR